MVSLDNLPSLLKVTNLYTDDTTVLFRNKSSFKLLEKILFEVSKIFQYSTYFIENDS